MQLRLALLVMFKKEGFGHNPRDLGDGKKGRR